MSSAAKSVRKLTSRNAARERNRVHNLRDAFQSLQSSLPAVPPNTKLSKLDVLILATAYIGHLSRLIEQAQHDCPTPALVAHKSNSNPFKKWPMRERLYSGLKSVRLTTCPCYSENGI